MLLHPQPTSQEQATLPKPCCKFRSRAGIKNKGVLLLLLWSSLAFTCVDFMLDHHYSIPTIQFVLLFAVMPIAGWPADVYCGRYKELEIHCGLWIMWIASMLATLSSVVEQLVSSYNSEKSKIVAVILFSFQVVGLASFQANILQFGLDQLYDVSTDEIISFIHWFFWTYCFGQVCGNILTSRVTTCLGRRYEALVQCGIRICLTITLSMSFLLNYILIKEPVKQNAYKQVFKVIKYAIKNKHPRCRSAFTYCEDELPSRIDFGKSKYGGPFTTEQVEDVKTFIRLIVVIFLSMIVMSEIIPIQW